MTIQDKICSTNLLDINCEQIQYTRNQDSLCEFVTQTLGSFNVVLLEGFCKKGLWLTVEDYLKKEVHEEFVRRVEAEADRQNARLDKLENMIVQINELSLSVKELAINMESAIEQIAKQNTRIEKIESRAGENWQRIVGTIITSVVGALVGYFMALGLS